MVDRTKLSDEFTGQNLEPGNDDHTIDRSALEGFYVTEDKLLHISDPNFPLEQKELHQPLAPQEILIQSFQLRRGRRVVQHEWLHEGRDFSRHVFHSLKHYMTISFADLA